MLRISALRCVLFGTSLWGINEQESTPCCGSRPMPDLDSTVSVPAADRSNKRMTRLPSKKVGSTRAPNLHQAWHLRSSENREGGRQKTLPSKDSVLESLRGKHRGNTPRKPSSRNPDTCRSHEPLLSPWHGPDQHRARKDHAPANFAAPHRIEHHHGQSCKRIKSREVQKSGLEQRLPADAHSGLLKRD